MCRMRFPVTTPTNPLSHPLVRQKCIEPPVRQRALFACRSSPFQWPPSPSMSSSDRSCRTPTHPLSHPLVRKKCGYAGWMCGIAGWAGWAGCSKRNHTDPPLVTPRGTAKMHPCGCYGIFTNFQNCFQLRSRFRSVTIQHPGHCARLPQNLCSCTVTIQVSSLYTYGCRLCGYGVCCGLRSCWWLRAARPEVTAHERPATSPDQTLVFVNARQDPARAIPDA